MVLSVNDPLYRQCALSVMDNIADPGISFDEKGICNYYYDYKEMEKRYLCGGEDGMEKIKELINSISESGKGKKYNCMIGVSGGVDSTYLVLKAKEFGLRPLCV